ncbi:UNVERIFIED_CONTAM: hypothetical protein FKN15_033104 [Acipenser sinensis]
MISELNSHLLDKTAAVFRTAYLISRERLAFSKMDLLVSVQDMNGAKMGSVH